MKRSKGISIILGILVLISSGLCLAQDIDLERIVVTPSRLEEDYGDISRKVDVITSEDIESSSIQDLSVVLGKLTSVDMSNYGGPGATKTIRMRGSSAAQVLVLVDGRPINNPRDGEAELSNIPLENIDRIEVMHGPASNLYGSAAMGGTVNIITKKTPKEKQETEFTTSFGTFRTYIESLSYGGRVSKLGYLISGIYKSSKGFRDNSDFCAKDFNTKLDYELNNDNILSLNSGFYTGKIGAPGKITDFDKDDKQRNLKNYFDLNWDFKPDNTTGFAAKVYQNYDRLEFIENEADSPWDIAFSKAIHTTKVRGIDLKFNKRLSDNYQGICGFNYVKNLNDSTTTAKHKYSISAGYLENQLDLFKDLKINLGARVDHYSNFGTQVNPSFAFVYTFSENNKLHGLLARSFRAPTFNDLYWPNEGWARGNPNVKPEKGITSELGIGTKVSRRLATDLTYYRNDYSQLINWGEDAGVWQPKNIGSATIDGIEFENKIYLINNFELDLGYTYLRAKDDRTHRYLIYHPKHKLDCSLRYNGPDRLMLELKGQFTDKRFHDPDNTAKVKKFFVMGFNVSKEIKQGVTFFIFIENLLNKQYEVIRDYPMPGFSVTSGFKIKL